MKENKYDDPQFFEKYSHMARSEQGLEGAGEWYALQKMLPDFSGKRVLDLGCGYGWHCRYAARQGAAEKMQFIQVGSSVYTTRKLSITNCISGEKV